MITHLEPDILECEVKWALGNITMNKASGGDGIPVELFQILKDDALTDVYTPSTLQDRAPVEHCLSGFDVVFQAFLIYPFPKWL